MTVHLDSGAVSKPGATPSAGAPFDIATVDSDLIERQAKEIAELRSALSQRDELIASLTQCLNSPVFLIKAAIKNLNRLVPYSVGKLRERQAKMLERRRRQLEDLSHHQLDYLRIARQVDAIRKSDMFDREWYLSQYPDAVQEGADPITHYVTCGAERGYDPNRSFSTTSYLNNNPDVAAAGVNPFLHYINHGRSEGRQAESNDYQQWVDRFDVLTDAARAAIRSAIERFPRRPLISVVIPVYNTEREWLVRAIESVRAQLYPYWELCISDDASPSPHVREVLDEYANRDHRIRVVYRQTNGHISLNTNSALALATGEFVALMDDDDELTEHALFWVANEIVKHPDVDLIYSDEDKIDVTGRRYDAYFKPDWNPALILSQNFVSHLGVYRRDLLESVGGLRAGFEGSQDHDLLLRCADESSPERIRHIPRVLYHWRSRPGSTASVEAIKAKPYAWHAAAMAIEQHLERRGIEGKVKPALDQYYQVDYPIPSQLPKVSIIMPSACKLHLLKPCMEKLFSRTTYKDFELLLVVSDIRLKDREQAAYLETLKANPQVKILIYEDRPYNYSWLNNWAACQASGSVLCFMNDDIEVITRDWLERFVSRLALDDIAAVGAMLYYPEDAVQHAGVTLGLGGVAGHRFIFTPRGESRYFGLSSLEQDVSCVTAACMAMRRRVFEEIGGFNESLAIAFNDVDLCIRTRLAGWRIIWTPQVEMYHHESASLGKHNAPERKDLFDREVQMVRELWADVLDNDPFYNPNLSLLTNNFSLAFPPRIANGPVP